MSDTARDPNQLYPVIITAPVEIAGTKLWPGDRVELRGDLADEHAEAVAPDEDHG